MADHVLSQPVRPKPVVFIVDDDNSVRRAVARAVRWAGLDAETFASGEDFLASGRWAEKGCLVLDLYLPGMHGLELQRSLLDQGCNMRTVFISAHENKLREASAEPTGAVALLHKPFDESALMHAVRNALEIPG